MINDNTKEQTQLADRLHRVHDRALRRCPASAMARPRGAILRYTILYYTILYYIILYYTILYYNIIHYTTLHYTTLHYTMT